MAARSGATTWVDAGSFGYDLVEGFRRFVVLRSQSRIFGYIYLYPSNRNPDIDPVKYVQGVMRRTGEAAQANRDIILGIKIQVGSNMNGKYSLPFLKIARELCDQFKLPLMAHISFAPPETPEVMDLMRPGDVVTHCYNGHTLNIVDETGRSSQECGKPEHEEYCSILGTGWEASTSPQLARPCRQGSCRIRSRQIFILSTSMDPSMTCRPQCRNCYTWA